MKNLRFWLLLSILLTYSCSTHGPSYVDYPYGASVSYGEGRHPGIDFNLKRGTPIIAVSDGEVIYVGDPCPGERHCGGIFVGIRHGDHFKSLYGHLDKAFVEKGRLLKRG